MLFNVLRWFVLEGLDIKFTIKQSIGGTSHNDMFFICLIRILKFSILFIRESLHSEFVHVMFFLASNNSLIFKLESIIVIC